MQQDKDKEGLLSPVAEDLICDTDAATVLLTFN